MVEFKNYNNPHKCYICKKEDASKYLDGCKKKHLSERILCIEAEKGGGDTFILNDRFFTIHEKDFIGIMGRKENTLKSRIRFMNKKVFDNLIEKAKKDGKAGGKG